MEKNTQNKNTLMFKNLKRQLYSFLKGVYSDTTQLNSTELNSTAWTTVDSVLHTYIHLFDNKGPFVGRDVINKNTTDLAVRCSAGSVEFRWVQLNSVELSWVELCRYKHPFRHSALNNDVTLKFGFGVVQDHWKWHRSIRISNGRLFYV